LGKKLGRIDGDNMKNTELRCPGCGESWLIEDLQTTTDRAKWWSLKDPDGRVHQFMDLTNFVNSHTDLFKSDDLVMKRHNGKWEACNAYYGLASLRPSNKRVKPIWKGWTWYYDTAATSY
jgi:hypothetical protein